MGLAIFAVVLSHAAGWGQIAMINWADRYRPVSVPNFDQVGSLSYDVLLVLRQLTVWAVPAFLFCSGVFVTYAARGSHGVFSWKMARTRVIDLLIPYVLWSLTWFVADALEHYTLTPGEYLSRLITGTADGGTYFFVPLLCQFYLLSPWLVPIARAYPKRLLAIAVLVQTAGFIVQYLLIFGVAVPPYISWIIEPWLIFRWVVYFALGLVFGIHVERLKQAALRHKWVLVGVTLLTGFLAIFEAEAIYWVTRAELRYVPLTFTTALFSIAFVLVFVVFDKVPIPFPAELNQLGSKSYGIYLVHMKAMSYTARVIRQVAPWILAYQVLLFTPIMLVVGLGVPLLLMAIVTKSPVRKSYHYVFG
jgi:membrane-bound acyltransferase YfiQ involved in biofilm formation